MRAGIVVATHSGRSVTVGFIDPQSGSYSEYARFNPVGNFSSYLIPKNQDVRLAPDLKRYATQGDGSVGWVDEYGKFTDVTPPTVDPGPFGGEAPSYGVVGFDGVGNFYYTEFFNGDYGLFRIPNGQTSGATPVGELGDLPGPDHYLRNGTGELIEDSCIEETTGAWLSPTEVVLVSGLMDNELQKFVVDKNGCIDRGSEGANLLPEANLSEVINPVGSPDRSKVAFRRDTSELWIVDASGGGTPIQVPLRGISLEKPTVMLVGWTA